MSQLASFLDAVRASPTEDAPRLVFADWLDDHGDSAWAEFIRLQCAPEPCNPTEREVVQSRVETLRAENIGRWLALSPSLQPTTCEFRRGFVEEANVRVAPRRDILEGLRSLLGRPHLAALRRLKLFVLNLGPPLAEVLARSPSLAALEDLDLLYPFFGDAGLVELARSPHLPRLRSLRVVGAKSATAESLVGAVGMEALAESPLLGHLESLDLIYNRLDARAAGALASSAAAPLRHLRLCGNSLGSEGAIRLAGSAPLRGLEELDLSCNDLGDDGVEVLANSPILAGVRHLSLGSHHMIGDNPFGDRAGLALARSPHLEGVAQLDLTEMEDRFSRPVRNALQARFGDRLCW